MLGLIMAIIDLSIVNVALTDMAGTLGASIDEISWVATGYILAQVVVMPLNGWLTALFGRKNFYAGCIALFTIASFLCGTATNVTQLVLYRDHPRDRRRRAAADRAGDPVRVVSAGEARLGDGDLRPRRDGRPGDRPDARRVHRRQLQLAADLLHQPADRHRCLRDDDALHPRSVVYQEARTGCRLDRASAMAIGIASAQYVLERGQREDWFQSGTIVAADRAVRRRHRRTSSVREVRDPHAFVDLRVFKSRSFTAGNIIGVVSGFGLFGLNLMLPLFFQNVLHFDAWQTGVALVPGAAATAVSMPLAARFGKYIDGRISIAFGLIVFAVGAWMMGGLNQTAGFWDVFWPRVTQGFALGFLFVPLTTITLSEVPRHKLANATGIFTLVRQLGGSLGIALLQVIETRREDGAVQALSAGVTLGNPAVAQMLAASANSAHAIALLTAGVFVNATVIGYTYAFQVSALLFILAVPTVLLLRPPKRAVPSSIVNAEIAVE